MTDDDIQRGLALCEAATRETWQEGICGDSNLVSFDGEDIVGVALVYSERNLRFIAEARTLLPAALREVQRLRGELEQARAERDKLRGLLGEALWVANLNIPGDYLTARDRLARIAQDGGVEP